MKKLIFTILGFCFLSISGYSVLPPLAEDIRELNQIINSCEFYTNFGSSDVLQRIEKNEKGYFFVTNKRTMQVDVNYIISELIGPAQYTLDFHAPEAIVEEN